MEKLYTAADLRELLAEIEKNSVENKLMVDIVRLDDIRSCFARLLGEEEEGE